MASNGYVADGTILVSRFVMASPTTDFRVIQATANAVIVGISQEGSRIAPLPHVTADPPEAAIAGEQLNIFGKNEVVTMLEAGTGGVVRGDLLEAGTGGTGITALTTVGTVRNIGARALESAAAGELVRVEILKDSRTNPAA